MSHTSLFQTQSSFGLKTTRPTRKEPYTGFVFTQRPRWYHSRGHHSYESHPVLPPHQFASHLSSPSTKSPSAHLPPPTTAKPHIETTTQWWPPGVSLGSQPPVSRIPIHVIYPEIARWEMDWPNVKVRTSGTRYTYAPEVENYPITFDWHVPRHLRTDKWTQRPHWPLETPLFSSEAYDYLEERTLPRILESGETEFPPTSPPPWWTYPPWWLEKKALESINGTTPRPYMRKKLHTSAETATTFGTIGSGSATRETVTHKDITTNEHKVKGAGQSILGTSTPEARFATETKSPAGINIKSGSEEVEFTTIKESQKSKTSGVVSHETTLAPPGVDEPQQNNGQLQKKTHHKGPWWHLTIIEHLTTKPPSGASKENNRVKRSPKLVRQNAFRRKWKNLRQRKNLTYTLDLKHIKPLQQVLPEGNESPSIKRVLSNYSFTWPKVNERRLVLSKVYIEDILIKALNELKEHLLHVTVTNEKHHSGEISNDPKQIISQKHLSEIEVEKYLSDLHNLFLSALNNFTYKQGSSLIFHIFTNEIGREMVKHLLNHRNIVRQHLDRLLFGKKGNERNGTQLSRNHVEKSRLIHMYRLFNTYNLIHRDISDKIVNIIQSLYGRNMIGFFNCSDSNIKHSLNVEGRKVQLQSSLFRKLVPGKDTFIRNKREDIIDITECPFNLSAQSVENVVGEIVDEIVEELPIDEINQEVKTDVLTAMHENQLKRLGKTHINRDVLREMMKLEPVDEAKFRNATEVTVRRVIMKMVNEVLNTLKQNTWMKDLLIKLFEEGYSVDSVLDTITEQISVDELMNSMQKDGINITRYQKKIVHEEFKDYKSLLRKMLTQEVQLWEYQLLQNQTLVRHRRDVSNKRPLLKNCHSHKHIDAIGNTDHDDMREEVPEPLRVKRDINDNEITQSSGGKISDPDLYDGNDVDIDKELEELKKSSMSKREKVKVLRKRLKGLLSQTENPDDIVFPDNFEEELMRTENFFDEEVTQNPQRFKQRVRWNVRTKKPTTKVITYPMKIRLNRGRPFVPLTTTEEQTLIMVVTQTPSRKYRTKKPAETRKVIAPTKKGVAFSTESSPSLKRQFWLDFTTAPADFEVAKPAKKVYRTTLKPLKTFATLRTFKTMKFIQKTQQPVISLQEFLKRRDEFRREKQDEMFNRPWSEEDKNSKPKDARSISDLTEEEEEFSFEAKLSGEISPSVFTLPPTSNTNEPTKSVLEKPSLENHISQTSTQSTIPKLSPQVTRKKVSRRKSAARSNKTRTRRPPTRAFLITEKASTNLTIQVSENKNRDKETSRRKRDLSSFQSVTDSIKPVPTNKVSKNLPDRDYVPCDVFKLNDFEICVLRRFERTKSHSSYTLQEAEGDFNNDITIPPLVIQNEKWRGPKHNMSRQSLEDRIHLHNWSYGVQQPKESKNSVENKTDSFETYQREHRKWFGIKKRGVPVSNFDIDWEQMRRKIEIHEISAWQRQKSSMKPTPNGKQQRRNERYATPLTQATTPLVLDSSEKPSNFLDNLYKSALKKTTKVKSFAKYYISEESIDSKIKDFAYPPFGRMEKDGHTAFGRLYQGKKHYQVEDLRDSYFEEDDLQQLVNKTYDPVFRISTHRESTWNNRTFDPNYVFTQFVPLQGKTRARSNFGWKETLFENENKTGIPLISTSTLYTPPETDGSFKTFQMNQQSSMKPKYKSFSDWENATEIVNPGNESYVLSRSKRIPWENNTDIDTYKTYIRSRKRFYNKTLDIAFSYYIFHKFRCGNKTRDLGYGRMSNVVNRWYNKTFIPKFRPDMFYVRNRYKRGKEFNYFKDEMNEIHAIISYGEFDVLKWMQVAKEVNLEESSKTKSPSDFYVKEESQEREKMKTVTEVFSSVFPPKSTLIPKSNLKHSTSASLKKLFTAEPTTIPTTKASFFRSVKEKGFGFFKSLFGKQDEKKNKD